MSEWPDAVERRYLLEYVEEIEKTPIILIKGIPDVQKPFKWAVMLESRQFEPEGGSTETHEIARIDNYHENKPVHIHRKFEDGNHEEEMRHLSFHEAREYLEDNCKEFMKKYFEE